MLSHLSLSLSLSLPGQNSYGLLARFIPAEESTLPATAPLSLAFGPQGETETLLALYPDGRVFAVPVSTAAAGGSSPPPAAEACLVADAASAGSAACCMAVDAEGKFLLLAGPGAATAASAAGGESGEASSSVRASLWRFDRKEEAGAPSFTLTKIAAIGKPRPRTWLPSFLGGPRVPAGWRAVFADASGGASSAPASSPLPRPPLLAAVAPGGQAPPSLFVASPVSLSKLELFPPSCVRDASSAAWWGSEVVVVSSSSSGPPAAVAALAPPSGACVLASERGSGSSSSCLYEQLTPLMSRRSEHGEVQRVALLRKEESGSAVVVAARERLPPAAAAAAAAAAGDWATACSIAAAHPSGGWFARRADAVVHLPRWRAICLGGSGGGSDGGGFPGGPTAEAAAACLGPLRSRKAAVAAALSAVSTKGDAAVQIGLIDWALREISLHWPGGDDDDAEGEGEGEGERSTTADNDGGEDEALALAASCSGFPPPSSSGASVLWPSLRLPSHLWWALAKRAALRHAERLEAVSSNTSSCSFSKKFDRAAFAALRDADLSEVAAGVCAAGPPVAAAALMPLIRLHPRAMFVVPTPDAAASASSSSSARSLPLPPALAALSSLPETTPVADVVSMLRLVVEASREASSATAAGAGTGTVSSVVDACEGAAVTAALEAAGASGRVDLSPTEAAIAEEQRQKNNGSAAAAWSSASPTASPPLTDEQIAAWACARALAVDARTGQLGAAAALLDAVATLLVDRGGGAAAERVAALAEAARELSSAAASAASASSPLDASSDDGEDEEDEGEGDASSPRPPPTVVAAAWAMPLAAFASAPPLERARVLLGGGGIGGRPASSAAAAREQAAASLSRSIPSQEERDEAAAALLMSFGGGASQRRSLLSAAELAAAEAGDLRLFSSHERLAAACVSAVYSLGSPLGSSSSADLWGPALALLHVAWRPLRAAEAERRRGELAEERRRRREEREEKRESRRRKGEPEPSDSSVAEEEGDGEVGEEKGGEEGEEEESGEADGWEDASIGSAPKDEDEGEEQEEEEIGDEDEGSSSSSSSSSDTAASSEDAEDDYHFFDATPPPIPGSALSEIARAAAACRAAALLRSRRLGGQLSSAAEIRDAATSATSATAAAAVASFVAAAVEALRGPPMAADSEWIEASADLEDVRVAVEAFVAGDENGEESAASPSSLLVAAPLAAGALASCRWRAARTLLESLPPSAASSVALAAGVEHLRQATSLSDDAVAHAQQCLGLAPGGAGGGAAGGAGTGAGANEAQRAHHRLSSARRALAALRRLSDFGVDVSSPALFLDPGSGDRDRMEAVEAVIAAWPGAPREPEAVLRLAEDLGVVGPVPPSVLARHASAEGAAAAAAALDPRRPAGWRASVGRCPQGPPVCASC